MKENTVTVHELGVLLGIEVNDEDAQIAAQEIERFVAELREAINRHTS